MNSTPHHRKYPRQPKQPRQPSRRSVQGVARRLGHWLLWLLILVAVMALLLQLLLPRLATPENITSLLSYYTDSEVTIAEMQLRTDGYQVQGSIKDLKISQDNSQAIHAGQISFDCHLLLSIINNGTYCRKISADGIDINIAATSKQDQVNTPHKASNPAAAILHHTRGINELNLNNLKVQSQATTLHLPLVRMQNSKGKVDGIADITLPGNDQLQLRFATELKLLNAPVLRFHLQGNTLDLSMLGETLDYQLPEDIAIPSGKLQKLDLTGAWNFSSGLRHINITTRLSARLQRGSRKLNINARKLALNVDFGKRLAALDIGGMAINGQVWDGASTIYANFAGTSQKLWIGQEETIRLAALQQPWLWWSGQEAIDFSGEVQLANITLDNSTDGMQFSALLQAADFTNSKVSGRQLSANTHYANGKLTMDVLDASLLQLFLPDVLEASLDIHDAKGTISIWRDDGSLGHLHDTILRISDAHGTVRGAKVDFRGLFVIEGNHNPYGDFMFTLRDVGSSTDVIDYLPRQMGEPLRKNLAKIIPSGKVARASMLWNGAYADYPFNNMDGSFQATLKINDAIIKPGESLPPVSKVSADIAFNNQAMRATIHGGKWNKLDISNSNLLIKDMLAADSHMQIKGELAGTMADIIKLGQQNIIHDGHSGKDNKDIATSISGNGTAEVLIDVRQLGKEPKVDIQQALIDIKGGEIHSDQLYSLQDINGQLLVKDNMLHGESIKASWLGQAATISLRHGPLATKDKSKTTIGMLTNMDSKLIQEITKMENIGQYISGSSKIQIDIEQYDGNTTVTASSDLQGMLLRMPQPIGKTTEEKTPIQLSLDDGQIAIQWQNMELAYNNTGKQPEIRINGKPHSASLAEWVSFVQGIGNARGDADGNTEGDAELAQLPDINIQGELEFASLELFAKHYPDSKLTLDSSKGDHWQVGLANQKIASKILIPKSWLAEQWIIEADYLRLAEQREKQQKKTIPPPAKVNPHRTPTVDLHVKSILKGEYNLGELKLKTERVIAGQSISELSLNGENVRVSGHGEWLGSSTGDSHTSMELDIESRKLFFIGEFFAADLNTDDAPTEISSTMSWPGTPADFSIQRMLGEIQVDIGKGSFNDIQNQANRFLSIFSIGTVFDRLTLDFSELASADVKFSSISGSMLAKNGVLSTENLLIDGSAVLLSITGDVNLRNDQLNQEIMAVPKISGNLTLLGLATAGLPGLIGGGAIMLYNKIINDGDLFGNVVKTKYRVTGSIDEPQIEEVPINDDSKDQQTDNPQQTPEPQNKQQ